MGEYVYVDNSNLFIEGQRVSAVVNGFETTIEEALRYQTLDPAYRMDFGKIFEFVAGARNSNLKRAVLFGSRPPEHDQLWNIAEDAGFEVIVVDRNAANKEKKVDTGIVTEMLRDAYKKASPGSTVTLVAGDGDYVPAITHLKSDGFTADVVFWEHASRELKEVCSNFHPLNSHLDQFVPTFSNRVVRTD